MMRSALPMCSALAACFLLAGCRSPWIQCTITNHESTAVSLIEVDYPGGTFGVQTIAAGASFLYRFHTLGDDRVSIDFTDSAHHDHKAKGPELRLGEEGALHIDIQPDNRVSWSPSLTSHR
jgi:hypothetical protein